MGRSPSKQRRARKLSGRRGSPKRTKKVAAKGKTATKAAARPGLRRAAKAAEAGAEIARLSRELSEARARQAAASEVLQVISSSPGDLKPVFESMLAKAMRLCEAQCGFIYQMEQGAMRAVAEIGVPPAFAEYRRHHLHTGGTSTPADVVRATGRPAHVHDARDSDAYRQGNPNAVAGVELGGARTVLYVPMIRNDEIVGVINLFRQEVKPFADEQIALLENFAGQAVIAIENARLFNETKEALERQTATADILKVIASSPSELRPVFDAIAARSVQLVGGHSATVSMFVGDRVDLGAFTPVSPEADAALTALYPRRLADYPLFDLVRGGEVAQVTDIGTDSRVPPAAKATARKRGFRSLLFVPMNSENGPAGVITVTRKEPGTFAAQHVQLMQTFADQAVIAIQNARLFNETKEALERQQASAAILSAISNSVADAQPVFEKIVDSIGHLFGTDERTIWLLGDDGLLHVAAIRGPAAERTRAQFPRVLTGTLSEIAIRERRLLAHADVLNDPDVPPVMREIAQRDGGNFSFALAPMLWEGRGIGTIGVRRTSMVPFSEKECDLLRTFADQAVIAIQNARLFNETKEALARQTATADVLKVIASSPSNLQPVFDAIAGRSKVLIGAHSTTVVRHINGVVELASFTPVSREADAALQALFPMRPNTDPQFAQILRGEVALITDAESEIQNVAMKDTARMRGWRSRLLVPLKGDIGVIGWISITRTEPGGFGDKDIELLQTFADQAVIAISNVELFKAVQDRTSELSRSLDDLRAAQDRLVQTEKLASLGQLTAGIAHEIKNPLNFVNNFSALSAELIGELDESLAAAALDPKTRGDVSELTRTIKGNLEKIVQHGKRADSIVKNMLLHSRQGSGEHRSADINTLVEESLNLAYHGARAEKPDFNITLKRDLDPSAGAIELYPQEITRALLNMISNGFYAATRRAREAEDGFEPTLQAVTRDLSDCVEIRIRDNGTGISPEVKDKMFNPFFTTKPAGEGTGLGLSMSHDIIVKQHGGTIDVETEPGHFTEFVIVLPRANNSRSRG